MRIRYRHYYGIVGFLVVLALLLSLAGCAHTPNGNNDAGDDDSRAVAEEVARETVIGAVLGLAIAALLMGSGYE